MAKVRARGAAQRRGRDLHQQPVATVRYIARITDTTKCSPLFVDALAWLLASLPGRADPRGDAGMAWRSVRRRWRR